MISIGEPDVVVWFEDLLRLHGIKPEPFECNQFTREILLALKGALNVPEFHDLDLNHLVEVSPEADRLLDRMASMLSSINSADADSLSLITACEKLLLNGRNLKKRKQYVFLEKSQELLHDTNGQLTRLSEYHFTALIVC